MTVLIIQDRLPPPLFSLYVYSAEFASLSLSCENKMKKHMNVPGINAVLLRLRGLRGLRSMRLQFPPPHVIIYVYQSILFI